MGYKNENCPELGGKLRTVSGAGNRGRRSQDSNISKTPSGRKPFFFIFFDFFFILPVGRRGGRKALFSAVVASFFTGARMTDNFGFMHPLKKSDQETNKLSLRPVSRATTARFPGPALTVRDRKVKKLTRNSQKRKIFFWRSEPRNPRFARLAERQPH
jgi:hypothetical protein